MQHLPAVSAGLARRCATSYPDNPNLAFSLATGTFLSSLSAMVPAGSNFSGRIPAALKPFLNSAITLLGDNPCGQA